MTKKLSAEDKKICELLSRIHVEGYPLTLLECLPNIEPYNRYHLIEKAINKELVIEIMSEQELKYKISSIGIIWLQQNLEKITKNQQKNWWYKVIYHKIFNN